MSTKHLSTQFDAELQAISSQVMAMGGLVENQIAQAIHGLANFAPDVADGVLLREAQVNLLEMEIDRDLSAIIARRQPAAIDLRLLIAMSKITANLERVGDEAAKIARMAKSMHEQSAGIVMPISDLSLEARLASTLLRRALDAFARLDAVEAQSIIASDDEIDLEFDGFVRKLVTYMMDDPRAISASLSLLFVAKAIERIGDHAKNLAEFTIYVVDGMDVRHASIAREDTTD
ncbi:phosphate transport system protein [Variovorax boronicumulans]|uniref:phosphate signaling complex protein PhoU n=1 Tax=Variovorax boronicumulans TaxID=436515 RepID=UPI003396E483